MQGKLLYLLPSPPYFLILMDTFLCSPFYSPPHIFHFISTFWSSSSPSNFFSSPPSYSHSSYISSSSPSYSFSSMQKMRLRVDLAATNSIHQCTCWYIHCVSNRAGTADQHMAVQWRAVQCGILTVQCSAVHCSVLHYRWTWGSMCCGVSCLTIGSS